MDLSYLNGQRVILGLSGGINSQAILCLMVEQGIKPSELHIFYAHFWEHSPDTFQFVADGIRYARQHFDCVKVKITKNSVLQFFEDSHLIPHPAVGVCSRKLKREKAMIYAFENEITIDLIGYVKHELKRRLGKQKQEEQIDLFKIEKHHPIKEFTDAWCFEIVDRHIGWHPAIYDIVDENGDRVFSHNNCLPCKNMDMDDLKAVKKHYPVYHSRAMQTSKKLKAYYGRDKAAFYTTFGRDLGQDSTCKDCVW